MIKKYALLTLILSLVTTQSYGNGIFSRFLNKVVESKTGVIEKFFGNLFAVNLLVTGSTSSAPGAETTKEKVNQEDYFVSCNMRLFKQAQERNNSFLQKLPEEQKEICKNMSKYKEYIYQFSRNLNRWGICLYDLEKNLRKIYQETPILGTQGREILNSDNPDFAKYVGFGSSSESFWDDLIMVKHCKECGYVNDDGSFNNLSVFKEDRGKVVFRENIEKKFKKQADEFLSNLSNAQGSDTCKVAFYEITEKTIKKEFDEFLSSLSYRSSDEIVHRCAQVKELGKKFQNSFSSYDLATMLNSEYEVLCTFVEKVLAGEIPNVSAECYATCEKIGTNRKNYTYTYIQENLLNLFNKSMEYRKFREFNGVFQESNLILSVWSDICKQCKIGQ